MRAQEAFLFSETSTGSGAQPASYSPGPKVTRPECAVNHSYSSGAEIKYEWSFTSIHPIYLHDLHKTTSHLHYYQLAGRI